MTFIKITNKSDPKEVHYMTTKNKNLREAVYIWRKKHNITYETDWKVVDEIPKEVTGDYGILEQKIKADTNTENTARTYLSMIKKYLHDGHKINDINTITSYVNNLPLSSKEKFLYSMIKANKAMGDMNIIPKITNLVRETKGEVVIERHDAMKEAPTKDPPTLKELKKLASVVPKSNTTYKFIANLYTNEVAWRASTLVNMTIDKELKEYNIVSLSKKEIEFNKYKTIKYYGKKTMSISPVVTKLMKKQFNDTGSKWLLPEKNGEPMSADMLSKIIKSIFHIGVREMRHAYITDAEKKRLNKEITNKDFTNICYRMNTSNYCGLNVYNDTKR
jgi:hypothetical protein